MLVGVELPTHFRFVTSGRHHTYLDVVFTGASEEDNNLLRDDRQHPQYRHGSPGAWPEAHASLSITVLVACTSAH